MNGWQVVSRLRVEVAVLGGWAMFALITTVGMPAGAEEQGEQGLGVSAASPAENRQLSFEEPQDLITDDSHPLAQEQSADDEGQRINLIPQLSELEQPATTVTDWVAQIEALIVRITEVRVEVTEAGLQVVLETENGSLGVPETRSIGNALIADIANAAIAEDFSQAEPIEGIALVSVTSLPDNRVRVAITGTDAPPVAEVRSEGQGLAFAVTLGDADAVAEEDAIQVVVTGEQDEGYNPSSASTATRTDTPLRDVPASIQVVPRQVLDDRNVQNLTQAVETVSGVVDGGDNAGATTGGRIIRGFEGLEQEGTLRNGFRDSTFFSLTGIGTIEQVEVLKGPASVLFGALSPGGITNVITRQPLSDPYYNLAFEVGNYGLYQPSIDLSGPLTADETVLYRFIASYQNADGFQEFVNTEQITIAPSITLNLGDRTDLNIYYEYIDFIGSPPERRTGLFSDDSFFPRDFFMGYPDQYIYDVTTQRFGYRLNHEFSDAWQLRNGFAIVTSNTRRDSPNNAIELVDDRFLRLDAQNFEAVTDNYFGQIDLLGRFNTGSIAHQLLIGFDYNLFSQPIEGVFGATNVPVLDIFDPDYDAPEPEYSTFLSFDRRVESYGLYIQDQVTLLDNLKLLIGGRYDWVSEDFETFTDDVDNPIQNDGEFSPRIGVVYQPIEPVSLYASYSRSFTPTTGFNPDGRTFEPTGGTQYEVGVKADFLEGRLSTTLAAYQITRTNITTPDPDNPTFSIQVGEQRSRGVELDVAGQILPGWNVIASYAYTDAIVTEDNTTPEGNRLTGVPENQASLWTTYTIQEGALEGLGFGLGLFYVGERQGDLANTFTLPDYLRTDAAIYYRRGRLNAAINVRNLFDTDYIRASGGGRLSLQRGAPLTIVGSISWTF
jgi:iron complex outermembrane receptor protein